ncbi:MAG: phosphate ABC transporter ATP-binding protein [Armatimonadetes bacterium]|nr:phosphate ABC transporter ATP-binding protein [Armatimonadota bacterium]
MPDSVADALPPPRLLTERLSVFYSEAQALKTVDLPVYPNEILGITGPSGSGKTTFLRMLNRLNDRVRSCRHEGRVLLDGRDVYDPAADVITLRRRVGMVFALPTPLPKTVFENTVYAARIAGVRDRKVLTERAEQALRGAILWDEVKDRLDDSALALSGGQQQRLCIARTLAQQPEVIMLDEPCSGLDPISTLKIEQALQNLKERYTIILVSHNVQQAARATDRTAFLLMGELVEWRPTGDMFTNPHDSRTADFLEGRFG